MSWTPGTNPPNTQGTPDTIVIQVPPTGPGFGPGPKQMTLISAASNGSAQSVNGLTLHVLGGAVSPRTDTATTFDNHYVADPSVVAADVGRTVTASGGGIPAGTTITALAPGGFLMSNGATASGTRTLTITKVDTGVSMTNGTHTANDPNIVDGDAGRTVSITGPGPDYNGRTITSVNTVTNPHSFVFNGNAASSTNSGKTATITKTDAGATINAGFVVLDASATAGDLGAPVSGPGIPPATTITAVTPGVSFTMSNPATAAGTNVSIVIGVAYARYTPKIVNVAAPTLNGTQLQTAIDGATPGDLLLLAPGTYNENVLRWKPLTLQGRGSGGIIGAHELQARDPEDPRFNIQGTVIDGRYFQQNATVFDARVAAPTAARTCCPLVPRPGNPTPAPAPSFAVPTSRWLRKTAPMPRAVAVGPVNLMAPTTARIDGLGLMTGPGEGAGGVQLQANINNIQITNNVLENNSGVWPAPSHRTAVRARKPQPQRPDEPQPGDRQRRPDVVGRHRDLLRLQQLRGREQRRSARTSAWSTGAACPTSASARTGASTTTASTTTRLSTPAAASRSSRELPIGDGLPVGTGR